VGIRFAIAGAVILRLSAKGLLILAALLVSAAKLSQEGVLSPMAATQELNRCLTCVRVAASRRGSAAPLEKQLRRQNNASDRRPRVTASLPHSALFQG
jgi:hypothetical protein